MMDWLRLSIWVFKLISKSHYHYVEAVVVVVVLYTTTCEISAYHH